MNASSTIFNTTDGTGSIINSTGGVDLTVKFDSPKWVIPVLSCFGVLITYISVSTYLYMFKCGRKSLTRKSSSDVLYLKVMDILLAITCVCSCLVVYVDLTKSAISGPIHYKAYSVLVLLKYSIFSIGQSCIYILLYSRQRAFYNLPTMKTYFPKYCLVGNNLYFILLLGLCVLSAGIFISTRTPEYTLCLFKKTCLGRTEQYIKHGIFVASTSFGQITLLGMLSYPIHLHGKNSQLDENAKRGVKLIKRALILTLICIASHVLTVILVVVVLSFDDEVIGNMIYDINLIIQTCCVICNFSNRSERMSIVHVWIQNKRIKIEAQHKLTKKRGMPETVTTTLTV
uniref:uncharacterized protein LOC120335890 n=1 Tax=Styela clava TaxID=7725 RepID=UPI001939F457|nr:uncharacterized protein LOC120335890 [Styela clava]